MTPDDFMSLVLVSKGVINRKKNTAKDSVQWLKNRWTRVEKSKGFEFNYRYSLNELEAWKTVDLKRKSKGSPPDLGRVSLPRLYTGARQIKSAKKTDLLFLLCFVPPVYHAFYNDLVSQGSNEDVDEDSDEENNEDSEESSVQDEDAD